MLEHRQSICTTKISFLHSLLVNKKVTDKWLDSGSSRKMEGYVPGETLTRIAASSFIPPLGYLAKANCEWGTGLGAVRGPLRCLRYEHCLLRVWDEKPSTSVMILQLRLKTCYRLTALGFWKWKMWPLEEDWLRRESLIANQHCSEGGQQSCWFFLLGGTIWDVSWWPVQHRNCT